MYLLHTNHIMYSKVRNNNCAPVDSPTHFWGTVSQISLKTIGFYKDILACACVLMI